MRHQITIPVTVRIPEAARPFDDALVCRRMREAIAMPPASKLLAVKIIDKSRDPASMDFVMRGEMTFGRWFRFMA